MKPIAKIGAAAFALVLTAVAAYEAYIIRQKNQALYDVGFNHARIIRELGTIEEKCKSTPTELSKLDEITDDTSEILHPHIPREIHLEYKERLRTMGYSW